MRRVPMPSRPNLNRIAEDLGYDFRIPEDSLPVWNEDAAYAFTLPQIEQGLEAPTAELHEMCLDLVTEVSRAPAIMVRLGIPAFAHEAIRESVAQEAPSLYGRFDLAYDGSGPAKLLEYNADTPTALYEAAVFQWSWFEDLRRSGALAEGSDQFNSLHEKIVARFAQVHHAASADVHLCSMSEFPEDLGTVRYLADCAAEAGLSPRVIDVEDLGLRGDGAGSGVSYVDRSGRDVRTLFKLYPWEWLLRDEGGRAALRRGTVMLEPVWKMILSNKGILPLLWERYPDHPNLLPAFFEDDPRKFDLGRSFVRKAMLGREGANVMIVRDGEVTATEHGPYAGSGFIRQAIATVPQFDGLHAVVGSWIIGEEPAGIIMRESASPISNNGSQLLPHFIVAE